MEDQSSDTPYIRSCLNDGTDILIVCLLNEQAELWKKISTFQVDMTFKHARDADCIDFVTFYEPVGKGR
jgi:hypothetical protein